MKPKRKTTHSDGPQINLSDDHGVTLCDALSYYETLAGTNSRNERLTYGHPDTESE